MKTGAHEFVISPEILLRAYAAGVFPMARSRHDTELCWIDPDERGILPFQNFHIPKSLRKALKRGIFEVRVDAAFDAVMRGCAEPTPGRPETWINDEILRLYNELFGMGYAHSVECWRNGELVGGLYGVQLGGAFFGESMFSRATDASKIALCHLMARLKYGGFRLLDTQFVTDHLERFGAIEIPRHEYLNLLMGAVNATAFFPSELPESAEPEVVFL